MQRRQRGRDDKTERHAAERDLIRDDEVLEVDKRRNDQPGEHEAPSHRQQYVRGILLTECQPAREERQAGEQLDGQVAGRNGRGALPAFPPQPKPAHDRDVKPPRDREVALGALRSRLGQAQVAGHPVNANIEKTADDRAEHKKHEAPKNERSARPKSQLGFTHHRKCATQARCASRRWVPVGQSRFPAPWLPAKAACRARWLCGSRLRPPWPGAA